MSRLVGDGLVQSLKTLHVLPFYLRLDVLPFSCAYILCFASYEISFSPSTQTVSLVALPVLLVFHLLLFLFIQGSVRVRQWVGYREVSDVRSCSHVLVAAVKNAGEDRILELHHSDKQRAQEFSVGSMQFVRSSLFFEYQKVKYGFDDERNLFVRMDYLTRGTVNDFMNLCGHNSEQTIGLSSSKWGRNEFDIPVPSFLDLYVEHLVSPFFVFQVLCLVLWSLDDYWYYSLLTLFMLMLFEGLMCKQRQASLLMLREMRREDLPLLAFRVGKWVTVSSNTLLPGDVICLSDSYSRSGRNPKEATEWVVPCDALLLRGSCVVNEAMLTGESVPQLKDSLRSVDDPQRPLDLGQESTIDEYWRRYMVFGGTTLLQSKEGPIDDTDKIPAPVIVGGCLAVVVRTGFGTSQGGMMRKILFARERVTSNSNETFYFILVLVVFAIFASYHVLAHGLNDPSRNRFKLVLHCIMIVTSVVPPELPMELSLAVTNSLAALSRSFVFCTEPYRIAFAGKLDILCFDKTGTLTKDRMYLKGLVVPADSSVNASSVTVEDTVGLSNPQRVIVSPADCSVLARSIMASCHSLFVSAGKICGDPLECVTVEATGYSLDRDDVISSVSDSVSLKILQRYPFSSSLKRMSVRVDSSILGHVLFTKGAPEILSGLFIDAPQNYVSTYTYHMSKGKRVLALGYRNIDKTEQKDLKRQDAEKLLHFVGFLIFDCDLKPDSKSVIKELVQSEHRVVMITGDSSYTACEVARKVGMLSTSKDLSGVDGGKGKNLFLKVDSSKNFCWDHLDESSQMIPFDSSLQALKTLSLGYNLCVSGDSLISMSGTDAYHYTLRNLSRFVSVFARVSPRQKEEIVHAMNDSGYITLMVGDGTNDVGALKTAHVGVSIVNDPDFETRIDMLKSAKQKNPKSGGNAKDRMERALVEMQAQEMDPTIVKLGDASIASPFTSRRTSIDAVLTVIRQGRATLVTTVQIYKILALNCLVTAYVMSTLYLRGLKQGDIQMTASGLITAALFFMLSLAKPMVKISTARPAKSVFSTSVVLSIIGQFCVHLASLFAMLTLCEKYSPRSKDAVSLSVDGKFQPNLVNSAMFLLGGVIQINNFVVNYRGEPFTQGISENTIFWNTARVLYLCIAVAVSDMLEPFNDLLQMIPFPSHFPEFKSYLAIILILNTVLTYGVETLCRMLE